MKKLITLILLAFVLSCATPQIVPTDGTGYSWWKDAPSFMSKDCIDGGFGLMDGIAWTEDEFRYYFLKVDNPDNGLGTCDDLVLMVEQGTSFRHGGDYPTFTVIEVFECEHWEMMLKEIKKWINDNSA